MCFTHWIWLMNAINWLNGKVCDSKSGSISFIFSLYVHSTQILVGNSRWCSFAREEIEKCGKTREKVREIEGKPRTIGEKARDSIFSILINECIQFGLLFLQTATRWIFWEFQLNQMSCSLCSCWMFWLPNLSKEKKTTNEHTRTHAQIRTCIHKLLHNINDSINFVLASLIRIDRYERLLACYKRMYHLILIGSLALFLLSKQSKKSLKRLIYCFFVFVFFLFGTVWV